MVGYWQERAEMKDQHHLSHFPAYETSVCM